MNSTISLLGGVPFTAGRVLFIGHFKAAYSEAVKISFLVLVLVYLSK